MGSIVSLVSLFILVASQVENDPDLDLVPRSSPESSGQGDASSQFKLGSNYDLRLPSPKGDSAVIFDCAFLQEKYASGKSNCSGIVNLAA